ncbi:hypothetical protein [Bradyrhizobium sp. 191]|uniref:hypothetical protein n=1 Tax=Bradyrhizobium sp. 191 TaxID=2782659 RepID=UPI0020002330|nr:hypothetical protein [Bradyrhizobium sp. 191]UPJ65241.1 hypothetical protein IVB23_35850 [Bradyrhizobium sp. 191]
MTALTADRATVRQADKQMHDYPMKAATKAYAGAIAVLNGGWAAPGATATGLVAVGVFEKAADNSAGANGDITGRIRSGVYRFNNSASTDLIAMTEVGSDCYIVDDNTVAKTNGSSTRSVAGKVVNVDSQGVWVAIGPGGVH